MNSIDLLKLVVERFRGFHVEYRLFASGAAMIDIRTMQGLLVIEWSPANAKEIGLSWAGSAVFGNEGADEIFGTLVEIGRRLDEISETAISPEAFHSKNRQDRPI